MQEDESRKQKGEKKHESRETILGFGPLPVVDQSVHQERWMTNQPIAKPNYVERKPGIQVQETSVHGIVPEIADGKMRIGKIDNPLGEVAPGVKRKAVEESNVGDCDGRIR